MLSWYTAVIFVQGKFATSICSTLITKNVIKSIPQHSTKYLSLKFTKSHATAFTFEEGSGENRSE